MARLIENWTAAGRIPRNGLLSGSEGRVELLDDVGLDATRW